MCVCVCVRVCVCVCVCMCMCVCVCVLSEVFARRCIHRSGSVAELHCGLLSSVLEEKLISWRERYDRGSSWRGTDLKIMLTFWLVVLRENEQACPTAVAG